MIFKSQTVYFLRNKRILFVGVRELIGNQMNGEIHTIPRLFLLQVHFQFLYRNYLTESIKMDPSIYISLLNPCQDGEGQWSKLLDDPTRTTIYTLFYMGSIEPQGFSGQDTHRNWRGSVAYLQQG